MIGQKRDALLSSKEREQMINRAAHDRQTLSDNDLRVKKKLEAWLDSIKDIRLILRSLPEDITRDVLVDENAFDLLSIAAEMMKLQKFLSISGKVDKPDEWQARGYGIVRQAEDKDIGRSLILDSHIRDLVVFTGEKYTGGRNPAIKARAIARRQGDVGFPEETISDEQKAIEKVKNAVSKYAELQHLAEQR